MSELDAMVSEETEAEPIVDETTESQSEAVAEPVIEENANSEPSSEEQGETGEPPSPEPEVAKTPESEPEQVMIPLAAKQAEKERRVRAETELAEFKAAQEVEKEPDAYLEPDKAIEHAVGKIRQEMQFERNAQSEAKARSNYDDFDAKMQVFTEMVQNAPSLIQEMSSNFDPGEFVYNTAKAHSDMKEIGNLDEYKTNLRTELKAEIMAELKAETPVVKSPPDLSTVRSSGSDPSDEIADGDDGLNQLLNR